MQNNWEIFQLLFTVKKQLLCLFSRTTKKYLGFIEVKWEVVNITILIDELKVLQGIKNSNVPSAIFFLL